MFVVSLQSVICGVFFVKENLLDISRFLAFLATVMTRALA